MLVGESRHPAVVVVGQRSDDAVRRNSGILGWFLGMASGTEAVTPPQSDQREVQWARLNAKAMAKDAALLKRSVSDDYRPAGFEDSEAGQALLQRLRSPGLSMTARDGVPLATALEELGSLAKLAVSVDWPSIREEGGTPEDSITSHRAIRGSAATLLRSILDGAKSTESGGSLSRLIDYDVRDGEIIIASRASLMSEQVLVIHDVRDLLIIEDVPGGPADTPEYRDIYELEQLIFDFVDANWRDTGQGTGEDTISPFDTFLAVHASPYSQRRVATLLKQLRDARRQSP